MGAKLDETVSGVLKKILLECGLFYIMKVNLMSAQDLRLHMNWHIFVFIVEIVIILKMMFF